MTEANALVSLGMLIAFLWLFYGPWQDVCTDTARQLMFERRDALFDLARAGKLDFSSKEYREIRRDIESMIRYAHELTWVSLYLSYRTYRKHETPQRESWTHFVDLIEDDATRDKVRVLLVECVGILVGMMAAKSILTAPIATVGGFYSMLTHGFPSLIRKIDLKSRWSSTIQWGASGCLS